jgi:hypothetical protein
MVHCDFIERNHDLDYFACFGNTQLTKYKKWEVISPRPTFKIWFSNMEGKPYPVKSKAEAEAERRKKEIIAMYEEEMKKKATDPLPVTAEPAPEDTECTCGCECEDECECPQPYISAFTLELMLIY